MWDLYKTSTSGSFPRSIPAGAILDYFLIPIKLIKLWELTFLHKQNTKCREIPEREHPAQQSGNPSGKLDTLNHVRFALPFFFFFLKKTTYFYFYSFMTQSLTTHLIENVKVAICITSQADSFSLWHQDSSSSGAETCPGMLSGPLLSSAVSIEYHLLPIWESAIQTCCLLPWIPQEHSHLQLNLVKKCSQHHPASAETIGTSSTAHNLLAYLLPKLGKTQGWGPMCCHGCSTLRFKDLEWWYYNRKTSKICQKGWRQQNVHVLGSTKAKHQVLLTAWHRVLPWPPATLSRNAGNLFLPPKEQVDSFCLQKERCCCAQLAVGTGEP